MRKRWLLSLFIIVNLATLAYVNLPQSLRDGGDRVVRQLPVGFHTVRLLGTLGRLYASVSGQNHAGGLFVTIPRTATYTVVMAEYADGTLVTLPLPLQSERTFWQRHFFDLKETQLLHRQERDAGVRHACADYLCRHYPERGGVPVRAIIWVARVLDILPPAEAGLAGTHLGGCVFTGVIERVPCRPAAAK
jgi:hypothetical protein